MPELTWTGERIIPDQEELELKSLFNRHFKVYEFSKRYTENKIVLDAGCGEGYGANYLAESAKSVIGIDVASEAILYAKEKYQKENLQFLVMDVCQMNFAQDSFEVVTSFQVIEHLKEYEKFVKDVFNILKNKGIFIVSTPNKATFSPNIEGAKGEFHYKEFYLDELKNLLKRYFKKIEIFGLHYAGETEKKRNLFVIRDILAKIDVFKLRRLIPKKHRENVEKSVKEEFVDEYAILKRNLNNCLDLVAVCGKI